MMSKSLVSATSGDLHRMAELLGARRAWSSLLFSRVAVGAVHAHRSRSS